jgi:deoxycytidylate deaminase
VTTAWIKTKDNLLLYANGNPFDSSPFASPVTRLIYGISSEFGEERFRFLRQRIFLLTHPSIWETNLVKVCAKRLSTAPNFELNGTPTHKQLDIGKNLEPETSATRHTELNGCRLAKTDALKLVSEIAAEEVRMAQLAGLKRHHSSRPVSALLCDSDDRVLGVAVNTNATCQLRHAEVNLLLQVAQAGISALPNGSKLYTSLKPCRMCASLLLSFGRSEKNSGPSTLQIFAAEDDPGTFGRHHLLDGILTINKQD